MENRWQLRNPAITRIRQSGNFVGAILLALLGANMVVSFAQVGAALLGFLDLEQSDYGIGNTAYLLLSMLSYVLYLGLPAVVVLLSTRRVEQPFPVCRVPRGSYVLAVFGGMAVGVFANWVSGNIVTVLTNLGVPYPEFPSTVEPTLLSLLLNLIGTAVLPALLEELVFRGLVLGALRPHGDRLAVIVSAVLFGLIHGNILQVPFATLLGVMLGWLTVRTGSILPAVVLHFVNNATSVVLEFAGCYNDSETLTLAVFAVFCVGGLSVLLTLYTVGRGQRDILRPLKNGSDIAEVRVRLAELLKAPALLVGGILWILVLFTSLLS